MDTGSNRLLVAVNVEKSIAEVKVLTQGYQAEYGGASSPAGCRSRRAVTKSGTPARPSTEASTTWNGTPTGTPTARRTSSTGTPRRSRSSGTGATRSAVRLEGPEAPTSSSSSIPGVSAADRREQRHAPPDADRARTGRGLLADDRQQRQSVSAHSRYVDRPAVHDRRHEGLLRRRRRIRPDSGRSALPARPES